MTVEEFDKRPENAGAPESAPADSGRADSGPGDTGRAEGAPIDGGNQRAMQPGSGPVGADELARRRRRGRRGRGGGQRFGAPQRGPLPPRPFAPRGPMPPRPMAPRDDEENSQARELANYERRQQAQRQRTTGGWRGGNSGWVPGVGSGSRGGNFFAGGARGPRRGPVGQAQYSETIRRATAGPRTTAAPSHDAGEPIAGPHAVLEAIRAGRIIKRLYVSNERGTRAGAVNELLTEAQERRIFVRYVDKLEVQRLSPIENHQGVVAIVEGKAGVELDELLLHLDAVSEPALVLVVDSLQDPQNFGVLLRSAEGAGAGPRRHPTRAPHARPRRCRSPGTPRTIRNSRKATRTSCSRPTRGPCPRRRRKRKRPRPRPPMTRSAKRSRPRRNRQLRNRRPRNAWLARARKRRPTTR